MTFSKIHELGPGGDDHAVVGFPDFVDWSVGENRCTVRLCGLHGSGDGPVGPQDTGVRVEHRTVIWAKTVLRIPLGHRFAAQ